MFREKYAGAHQRSIRVSMFKNRRSIGEAAIRYQYCISGASVVLRAMQFAKFRRLEHQRMKHQRIEFRQVIYKKISLQVNTPVSECEIE